MAFATSGFAAATFTKLFIPQVRLTSFSFCFSFSPHTSTRRTSLVTTRTFSVSEEHHDFPWHGTSQSSRVAPRLSKTHRRPDSHSLRHITNIEHSLHIALLKPLPTEPTANTHNHCRCQSNKYTPCATLMVS